jgi:DNA-binding NarL/FixJ family response regulator
VRILIADDHDVVRAGLRQLLLEKKGWEVCGEATTGRQAAAMALELKPDVVVMDIAMPELNGLEAARQIRKALPKTEIVVLTLHLSDQLAYEIIEAGIRGYVLKSDCNRDLVNAVESLGMHRPFFTARVSEMMMDGLRGDKPHVRENQADARSRLTGRQREIVQLLAEGKTSKEVAVALNISVKTAETHRANIMRRLELHSVSELVRYAVKNQIIEV